MIDTGALMSRIQLVEVSQVFVALVALYQRKALHGLSVGGRSMELPKS